MMDLLINPKAVIAVLGVARAARTA